MIPQIVYILCALTSLACVILLLRRYYSTKLPLLLWSGLAFLAFASTNILLYVDLVMLPQFDLAVWRNGITLIGVVLLLYGLIRTTNQPL
jgi:hypothetical protein